MLHVLLMQLAVAAPLVTGVVVDHRGKPVAGVHIDNTSRVGVGTTSRTDVVTGADGRFEVLWPQDRASGSQAAVSVAMVQARHSDGRSSEMQYPTGFPADIELSLRPAATLELQIAGDGKQAPATAFVGATTQRGSLLSNGGFRLHEGEVELKKGRVRFEGVMPGEVTVRVAVGEQVGVAVGTLHPGERTRLRVQVGAPGRIGMRASPNLGDAACLLVPGTTHDARRGVPTVESCSRLDPWHHALDDLVPGVQTLTVKRSDGTEMHRRLQVRPDTYCDYGEIGWTQDPVQGVVGVVLPVDGRPPELTGVLPASPAERAGLAIGDTILAIDGAPVSTGLQAHLAIRAAPDDRPVAIEVGRAGRAEVLKLRKIPVTEPAMLPPARCGEPPARPEPERRRPYGLPVREPSHLELPSAD